MELGLISELSQKGKKDPSRNVAALLFMMLKVHKSWYSLLRENLQKKVPSTILTTWKKLPVNDNQTFSIHIHVTSKPQGWYHVLHTQQQQQKLKAPKTTPKRRWQNRELPILHYDVDSFQCRGQILKLAFKLV